MVQKTAFGGLTLIYRGIPPRLQPKRKDITAGLIAVGAALVTIILFVLVWGGLWFIQESQSAWGALLLAGYAILFVVPAAFLVGFFGVNIYQPTHWASGLVCGLIATTLVYAVSIGLLVGTLHILATFGYIPSGDLLGNVYFFGLISLGTTSYLAFPVGAVVGSLYGSNRSS